jgi:cytochrome c oxidase subunit II
MPFSRIRRYLPAAFAAAAFLPAASYADQPRPWEIWHQAAASSIMEGIESFHLELMVICVLIVALVLGLLAYCILRFNERANPTPSRTTHNTLIEVVWTAVPVMILVGIAIPLFNLLYEEDVIPKPELTVKATGHQWYWSYEYPDNGGFGFDSVMVPDADLKPGQVRLLDVDNHVVLPVGTTIRVITTSQDVIHSWAVPAFGVKTDSVPGRLNEMWFKIDRPGTYYGQCSELCGVNHGFMPIQVEAVTKERYTQWVAEAKKKFASSMPATDERVAAR